MREEEKERREKEWRKKETKDKEGRREIKREEGSIHSPTPQREQSRVPSNHFTTVQLDKQIGLFRQHMRTELAQRWLYQHKSPAHSCGLTRIAPLKFSTR